MIRTHESGHQEVAERLLAVRKICRVRQLGHISRTTQEARWRKNQCVFRFVNDIRYRTVNWPSAQRISRSVAVLCQQDRFYSNLKGSQQEHIAITKKIRYQRSRSTMAVDA